MLSSLEELEKRTVREGTMEAIKFQPDMKFPAELEEQVQKILDFAEVHDERFGVVYSNDSALRKHAKLKAYIEEDVGPVISAIIKKHTGIVVTGLDAALPTSTGASLAIYVWFKNFNEVVGEVLAATEALADSELNSKKNKTIKEILDLNSGLNKVSGTIAKSITKFEVIVGLPVGAFCIRDYLTDGDKYQLTAGEITATLLHEVGHVFGYIEYLADMSYTGYYGNNPIRDLDDRFDKNPKATIEEVIKLSDKAIKDSESSFARTIMSKLRNTLAEIDKRGITVDDAGSSTVATKAEYKAQTAKIVCLIILKTLTSIMFFGDIVIIAGFIYLMRYVMMGSHANSKTTQHGKQRTMYERIADEYVSRHKRSLELNRALIKIGKIYDAVSGHLGEPTFNAKLRDSFGLRIVVRILTIVDSLNGVIMSKLAEPMSIYESDIVRLKRNINNMHDNLKDASIPKEIRAQIVADIDQMEHDFKMHSSALTRGCDKFLSIVISAPGDILVSPIKLIFGDANVEADHLALYEQLDQLMSNKSFYYSEKIKNTLR